MLKNYLTVALRHVLRQRAFSAINILGLALGLAVCLLIGLYIVDELSWDRFHEHAERIHRFYTIDSAQGVSSSYVGITTPALPHALAELRPEVEEVVRVSHWGTASIGLNGKFVQAEQLIAAEENFLDFFSFELLQGDPETAMSAPNSVLLTPTLAATLFGEEDPIGQSIELGSLENTTITGIIAPPPHNSHIQFQAVIALHEIEQFQQWLQSWGSLSITAYARLAPGAHPDSIQTAAIALARDNDVPGFFTPQLQPMTDLHLHASHMLYDSNHARGDIGQVRILAAIALFVLLIAAINFMNLATARSLQRAREVGMRKVAGATRAQMIRQFLGESLLTTLLAMLLALLIAELSLPWLSKLTGRELAFHFSENPAYPLLIAGLVLMVGLLAGLYPAFVLSAFKPITVLSGSLKSSRGGIILRRMLVIGQFAISIALITATLIAAGQVRYIFSMNLGYEREQVLSLGTGHPSVQAQLDPLRDRLNGIAGVVEVSSASNTPGTVLGRQGVRPEGATDDANWIVSSLAMDEHYVAVLGMSIVEGRNFSPDFPADSASSILINETFAKEVGWEQPVGKHVYLGADSSETELTVVGVVGDFHFASVRHQIEPVMFSYATGATGMMIVKLAPGATARSIAEIEAIWSDLFGTLPLNWSFLDDQFDQAYQGDINFATVVSSFSGLAIVIALLGLLGLAAYSTQQRRKEIAVRKVLGASEGRLVFMLTFDFLRWVALGSILAWPAAFFAMRGWLQDFVYRIPSPLCPFSWRLWVRSWLRQ